MQHFEYVHFGLIHRNRDIALSFAIQDRQAFGKKRLKYIYCLRYTNKAHSADDPLAQLVEQLTLNQWVEGSSPSGITM